MKTTIVIFLTILGLSSYSQCTPAITGQSVICEDACATLVATGATSYTWSPSNSLSSSTGSSVIACPNVTTNYTITGMTGTCISTQEFLVQVSPTIAIFAPSQTLCANSSVTLEAYGGFNYSWAPPTALNTTSSYSVIANPTTTIAYTVTVSNSACSSIAVVNVTVFICSGLKEHSENNDVLISPNPTSGKIKIEPAPNENTLIEVYDSEGRLVISHRIISNSNIDISSLNNGIYSLKVYSKSFLQTKKLIIMH